jgi:nucleotide-binding universal stress UspA family protein
MKQLLLVTDFKNGSHSAFEVALKLCRKHPQCRLHVLHVLQERVQHEMTEREKLIASKIHQDQVTEKMIVLRKQLSAQGIKAETICVEGDLVTTINDYSELQKIELVVAGHSNRTRLGDKMLGTHSEEIMKNASVPVLIVPQDCDIEHAFHKITYATDYHDSDSAMAEQLLRIVEPFHPQVNFLHICVEAITADQEWEMMSGFQKRITKRLDYNNFSFQVLNGESIEDQLIAYLDSEATEMLAVATHTGTLLDRLFGASAARTLIQNAQVPLLVFHYRRHFKPRIF